MGFLGGSVVKNMPAIAGDAGVMGLIPGREDPLEEDIAIHFSSLAWKMSRMGEPGGLQSTGCSP